MSKLSAGMLPHEKVAELVRIYGKGTSRMPLDDCGVGHLNRAISCKYVHSRLRLIVEVEGFSSMRYKFAIATEPSESDPLASTKRTQAEVADSSGMLAMVDNRSKNGFLTKNHLLLALLVLKDGRILKDHDIASVWKVPQKDGKTHKELHEVLERGLNVLLLDKSIWDHETPEDIQLIIDADNEDQISCLPDHEIHLFERIRKKCDKEDQKCKDRSEVINPKTLFAIVYADLKTTAGSYGKKDCTSVYNLAVTLTGPFGDFVVRFHFQFVNPSVLKVKPEVYGYVAALGDKLPWVKIALMLYCYMCHSDFYEAVGLIQYANALDKNKLEKLQSQVESWLKRRNS